MTITKTITITDPWYGEMQLTVFRSGSAGKWIVTKAVRGGWDVTYRAIESMKHEEAFRQRVVAEVEGETCQES